MRLLAGAEGRRGLPRAGEGVRRASVGGARTRTPCRTLPDPTWGRPDATPRDARRRELVITAISAIHMRVAIAVQLPAPPTESTISSDRSRPVGIGVRGVRGGGRLGRPGPALPCPRDRGPAARRNESPQPSRAAAPRPTHQLLAPRPALPRSVRDRPRPVGVLNHAPHWRRTACLSNSVATSQCFASCHNNEKKAFTSFF